MEIKELVNFGILNIDKPSGPTSFSVSDYVRKRLSEFGVNKTSHFGTLDPRVSGVLPIALGRACKLTGFFLGHDKEYVGIMRIHKEMKMSEIQEIINKKFLGKIKQTPPKKSRVKRVEREREIISFELLEQNGKDILFKTKVQGGTYIRKLIDDLGGFLKVQVEGELQQVGAHMLELRRVQAGIFPESKSVKLYNFDKAVDEYKKGNDKKLREMIFDAKEAIKEIFEVVECKKDIIKKLLTGKPIFPGDLLKEPEEDIFVIFSEKNFIGIYRKTKEDEIIKNFCSPNNCDNNSEIGRAKIFARAEFVFN